MRARPTLGLLFSLLAAGGCADGFAPGGEVDPAFATEAPPRETGAPRLVEAAPASLAVLAHDELDGYLHEATGVARARVEASSPLVEDGLVVGQRVTIRTLTTLAGAPPRTHTFDREAGAPELSVGAEGAAVFLPGREQPVWLAADAAGRYRFHGQSLEVR